MRHSLPTFCLRAIFLSVLGLIQIYSLSAQSKRANHFAIADAELDFNVQPPAVKREFAPHQMLSMGVMSDENGGLLFYSDGFDVWNRKHALLNNGGQLSTTPSSVDRTLAVPKPGSESIYYIFTTHPGNDGLYYSVVDMTQDGGYGAISVKSVKLLSNTSSLISAVHHSNGRDIWLMARTHDLNQFHAFLITNTGISTQPIVQSIGPENYIWGGQMKFSPDGKRLAIAFENDITRGACLFDFNSSNGTLSNPIELRFEYDSSPMISGIEFSSDATRLYVGELRSERIFQFDVSSSTKETIQASRTPVGEPVMFNSFYDLQLAVDGNIYCTKGGGGGGTAYMGVIRNPNYEPEKVSFDENGIYLNGGNSFVSGTPTFIQSYLFKTSFGFVGSCSGEPVSFKISNKHQLDSAHWSFGDGKTSKDLSPNHAFNGEGSYTVDLTAYYSGKETTISRTIQISPLPTINLGPDVELCEGSKLLSPRGYLSYQWNTGDTTRAIRVEESGKYFLKVQNEYGCFAADTIHVLINPTPAVELPDSVTLVNGTVELKPGIHSSYSWNTGESSPTLTVTTSGWYSVAVTGMFGCSAAKSVYVKGPLDEPQEKLKWIQLNPMPSGHLNTDMYFIDESNGFIVNESQILRTTDGGQNWNEQLRLSHAKRIKFHGMIGYVVGDFGTVYKSTQNGGGWNKVAFPFIENLNSISAAGSDTILIAGDNALFVSNDAGKSWMKRVIDFPVNVEDSYFTSGKVGHAVCKDGTILKTVDAGLSWRKIVSVNYTPAAYYRITFLTANVGYASREFSNIFKTVDGGETWKELPSISSSVYGIQILNQDEIFVAGEHGALYKSSNGGNSWESISDTHSLIWANDLKAVFFLDENIGFATGMRGRIIKTTNGGATWSSYAVTYEQIRQIEPTASNIVYATTYSKIMKSSDTGRTWTVMNGPVNDLEVKKIQFINSTDGFALCPGYYSGSTALYKTNDSGVTWTKTHLTDQMSSADLSCLYFVSSDVGFVSGGFNPVLKTIDGGANWKVVNDKTFAEIQFVSSTIGYARTAGYQTNYVYKNTKRWRKLADSISN
jgi:photosystem II stability/assembly factor-like uncharacterized protein